jgi:predicted GH43/DUF377 family glycosyl hydrolase
MSLITRYGKNPILGPNPDLPWSRNEARNPGVVYDGARFHMVFTAANDCMKGGEMVLGYAQSSDGFHFTVAEEPLLRPSTDFNDFDCGTVEDCRITELEGKYYLAYAGRSLKINRYAAGERRLGPGGNLNPTWTDNFRRVGLGVTKDWKRVERLGPITSEHLSDANVTLFPEKINGKYAMLHRPTPFIAWMLPLLYNPGCIWLAFSDNLQRWSSDKREMPWKMLDEDLPDDHLLIRPEYDWEKLKVGASGVPFATDAGWLMLYHAVDRHGVYRVGVLLLDRDDPRKIIARSREPFMVPEMPYELKGAYPGCIFPCAHVVVGDDLFIYYGAVDLYCCVATVKLKDLLDWVLKYRV